VERSNWKPAEVNLQQQGESVGAASGRLQLPCDDKGAEADRRQLLRALHTHQGVSNHGGSGEGNGGSEGFELGREKNGVGKYDGVVARRLFSRGRALRVGLGPLSGRGVKTVGRAGCV
jgi:hypothetical protein